jgi:hypothetical protein
VEAKVLVVTMASVGGEDGCPELDTDPLRLWVLSPLEKREETIMINQWCS